MRTVHFVTSFLLATTVVGGAYAADQAKATNQQIQSAENVAAKDVGKLSKDGGQAFQNMHMARLAIFNANPDDAKALIGKAVTEIEKAKNDEAVYMRAEAKLDAKLNQMATAQSGQKNATEDPSKEVAWLPIDGQLGLGEDFVATPEKTEAVKKANESVHNGDKSGAVETLKLAGIDVDFTMAVVPLDKTVSDIQQAAKLIDDGKYYEANALLKGTEDRMRFDTIDVVATPVTADATASKTTGQATATASSSAKPADAAPAK